MRPVPERPCPRRCLIAILSSRSKVLGPPVVQQPQARNEPLPSFGICSARQVIHSVATRYQGLSFLLLATLLLVACATVEAPGRATVQPEVITLGIGTTDGSCGTTLCCSNCPAIPVLRVIDGDTFATSGNQNVRLFGVDTPERGEKCYMEATSRLRELARGEVRVELGPRNRDRYGRLLYYVYTQDGDSIDEKLLREGLGEAWERDGQHRELLMAVEDGAERNVRGPC